MNAIRGERLQVGIMVMWIVYLTCVPVAAQVIQEMEVRLRQLTVHVRDASGNPISGLKAEDFVCRLGGDDVEPQGFRPIMRQSTDRPLTVFLDTSFMDRQTFDGLRDGLSQALALMAQAGHAVDLVIFDDDFDTVLDAATDPQEVISAFEALACRATFRAKLAMIQTDLITAYAAFRRSLDSGESRDMIKFNAENVFQKIAEKERAKLGHFHQVCAHLMRVCDALSVDEAHRSLYFISGGLFLEKNGRYEDTFQTMRGFADRINRHGMTIHGLVHNGDPDIGTERLKVSNRGFFNNYQAMKELAEYSYQEVRSQLELLDSGGNTLAEGVEQYLSGPVELCRWTGGWCEVSNPKFLEGGLSDFLSSHLQGYELDFVLEPEDQNDDLSIRLAQNQGAKITYPQTFRPPKPFRQWTKDEIETSFRRQLLFGRAGSGNLACDWGYRVFDLPDGRLAIPVFGGLTGADAWKKGLEVGFAALDENQHLLDLIRETVPRKSLSDRPLVYHVLLCDELPKTLRFFARERQQGGYAVGEITLDETEKPATGPHIGGLNLGSSAEYELLPLPHLKTKGRDEKRKDRAKSDPFKVGKRVIIPNLQPIFDRDADVPVYFQLSRAPGKIAQYGFDFYMTLDDESKVVPGKLTKITPMPDDEYRVEGIVSFAGLSIGQYVFTVVIFLPDGTPIQKSCYAWIVEE